MGNIVSKEKVHALFRSGMADVDRIDAVHESEERYRSLVESSGFGIATIDFRGRFTFVNEALCRIIGYSKKELSGKYFGSFLHPDDKQRILKIFLNALKNPAGKPSLEFRVIHRKGHAIPMYSTPTLYRRNGKILGFTAIIADITERKKAEATLRRSEERYRSLVELAPDGIMTIDAKGFVTSVNTAFSRLTGYSKDEFVGKHFARLPTIQVRDVPRYVKLFTCFFKGQTIPPVEFVYRRKNGTLAWGEAHPSLMKEEDHIVGGLIILRDITERKQIEEALKTSEEKFRSIFDSATEGMIFLDKLGRIVEVNRKAVELFGGSRDELLGKHFVDTGVVSPKDVPRLMNAVAKILSDKKVALDTCIKNKKGQEIYLDCSGSLVRIDDKFIGISIIVRDVTERKKTEQAVRESQQKFERLYKNIPDAAVYWDQDFRVLDINPRFTELFGYTLDEINGKKNTEIIVPEDKVEESDVLGRKAKKGYVAFETVRKKKDMSLVHVSVSTAPIIVENQLIGYMGLYKDITERKKTEDELRETKEFLSSLLDYAPVPIYVTSFDNRYRLVNRAWEEFSRTKREKAIGCSLKQVFSPETARQFQESNQQVIKTAAPLIREEFADASDGRHYFHTVKFPLFDATGHVEAVGGISVDVTERKLMETRLSALNSFSAKLNTANSLEGIYELILDAMEKTLGFEYAEYNAVDGDRFRVACQRGFDKAVCDLPLDGTRGGIIVRAATTRKAVLVDDVKKDPDYVEGVPSIRSELAVPVIADYEVIGVLNVESRELSAFDERDVTLLEILASHAATAISNMRKRSQIEMALKKIRESEEKYRGLFENARDVIVTVDCRGNVTSANNIVSEYGYKPDELVGKSLFSLFPKEYWKDFQSYFQKLVEGKPIESEFRIKSRQMQGYKVVEYKSSPIIQDGKVIGAQVIARDVTERKKMEEAMRASEEKFKGLFQNARDVIVTFDLKGNITSINKTVREYGFQEDELIGKSMLKFVPKKHWPRLLKDLAKAVRGNPVEGEIEIITPKGKKIVEYRSNSIFQDNEVVGLQTILRDITERKEMEQRLKQYSENLEELVQKRTDEWLESEKRYSVVVDEASDGVIITQDEKIVFANKKCAETFKYPVDELIGIPFERLVAPKYRERAKERYAKILRGEKVPTLFETDAIAKTGELIPLEVTSAFIYYQGRPADLVILRDVRERKEAEEQRLKLEKLAAIGELATMVAHDLRNPLTSIRNACFYIKNACPNRVNAECKTSIEMVNIIDQETLFANDIINDLLDFAAKRPLQKKRQNINKIIENSIVKGNIPRNVNIERDFDKNAIANVDETRLERVFLNMIKNAVQAMPNGGKLAIATTDAKDLVEIAFTDTGTGIPEEAMDKIFQPLFTTKAKGIGMGLPICKNIVEQHGGTIDVKSKVGEGTAFTVKLPKVEANIH